MNTLSAARDGEEVVFTLEGGEEPETQRYAYSDFLSGAAMEKAARVWAKTFGPFETSGL